jgi:hypothetical protein
VSLSELQSAILRLLATHRNPESCVAGGAVLNREGPRFSSDIDIFHDREEAVAQAAEVDAAVLSANGFQVRWVRREPGIHVAIVERSGETTRLEWARDSDFRFFPVIADELFGYRLHVADIATNKALAAAVDANRAMYLICSISTNAICHLAQLFGPPSPSLPGTHQKV